MQSRFILIRDLTNETELEEHRGLIEAHEKMSATVQHEMRTPLNCILQAADLLETKEEDPKKLKLINMV